jgi:ligand-binding sensor domain-containing protein/DNA-binding response OmpR family regulator/two-component sensor histidine kinase
MPDKRKYNTFIKGAIALISLIVTSWHIQASQLRFQHLSVDEGLKNSRVVSLVQDRMGYMWFATHNGLDKFNGTDMTHYSLSPEGVAFNNDDIVNCLFLSDHFDLICGTKNGNIYHYNRELDKFQKLLHYAPNDALFNIYAILAQDSTGLWIGNTSGLFYHHVGSHQTKPIKGINHAVNAIEEGPDGQLWIGTSRGLYILHKKSQTLTGPVSMKNHPDILEQKDIFSLLPVKNDQLLIGTRESEVFLLKRNEEVYVQVYRNQYDLSEKNYPVTDIVQSPDGNYAISLDGQGIFFISPSLQLISSHKADDNNIHSLSSNGVYELFYGTNGILWVGTYGGGVNYADPNQKQFQIIRHIPHINNSLRNNIVNSIVETDNNMWYGTKKGLSVYHTTDRTWKHIPSLKKEMDNAFIVMSMCKGQKDDIWIATYGRGLMKLNAKTFERKFFSKWGNGIQRTETNHLYQVIMDTYNRIWTGGIWGGITVIDEKKNRRHQINISNIRSLMEYNKTMYVGTLFGLFMVDLNTFNVTRPSKEPLVSSRIITMSPHPDKHELHFGTDAKGLIRWNLNTDSIQLITTTDGLPSNYIRSIAWDQNQQMWLTSTGGLSFHNTTTNTFDNYTKSDGLANTEFSENAVCLNRAGQLMFGGPKGVTVFNPSDITLSQQQTRPILNAIHLFGKKIEVEPDGILTKNINLQQGIHLQYNQNSIGISFGAIAFTNPQKISYKWKLEGLEDQWNGPSQTREATYTKLPPGNYIFKVSVSNEDGVWQNHIKEFYIKIAMPFWKTPLAFLLYILALAGLFFLALHYYKIILNERHTAEKQQFFISIAHDLRTPLSLIKLPIEKMVNEGTESSKNKNLELVKRNVDRLTNLVNQLLDFQKSDLKKMQLQVKAHDIVRFLKNKIDSFSPLAEEKNINVTFSSSKEEQELWFDKSKMEKILYNLLSNAFKYTPPNGKITVTLDTDQKYCSILVSDTGEGIPANQQKNIFQRYYRATNAINSQEVGSGVGLMLTKQLVELHKGKISFNSQFGKGSTFFVRFLLGRDFFSDDQCCKDTADMNERIVPINESLNLEQPTVKSSGPTLLLVEDNKELLTALANDLQTDYRILQAQDGVEGIKMAGQHLPDIIVSDVMMPNMNGHELCLKLKGNLTTCHIPIVLLTALDSPEYKREGFEHGADAYLEKPFDLKVLRSQINTLLRNRAILKRKFLVPQSSDRETPKVSEDQQLLDKVQNYVLANLDNDSLSVETTASEIGVSRPVLYRKIKALTDLSPQQYMMTIKLKEAARIMKEEHKNISETAYAIGFSDPKYFSQIFKKYFGTSPSGYIKSE